MTAPSFQKIWPAFALGQTRLPLQRHFVQWIALLVSLQLAVGTFPFAYANESSEGDDDGDGTGTTVSPKSDTASHDPKYSNLFDGSSQFSVPIALPQGRLGVAPSLGLSYSSNGGNGWVGIGWNIGGPAIERYQTHHSAPNYSSSDTFYSSGEELTSIASDEYRTHRESFSKITRNTNTNCWKVLSPDGNELQFGCTSDSKIGRNAIASPDFTDTHTWLLNRVTDTSGNQINYEYNRDVTNGDWYLQYIRYTQGNSIDTGQYVQFVTESRPDVLKNYSKRSLITQDQRLKEIQVYSGSNKLFGKYVLEYRLGDIMQMQSPQSKLIRITQYGTDGITPLISGRGTYEFDYTERSKSFTTSTTSWLTPIQWVSFIRYGHVNADAYPDILYGSHGYESAADSRRYYINIGNGTFASRQTPNLSMPFVNYTHYSSVCDFPGYTHTFDSGGLFIDLNGDGLDDMIARTADSGNGSMNTPPYTQNNAYLNAGNNTWTSSTSWLFPLSMSVATQDRHPIWLSGCMQFNNYFYHYAFSGDQGVRTIDVNGDRLVDLVKAFPGSPRAVYLNNGNGWTLDSSGRQSPIDFLETFNSRKIDSGVRFADANGDGQVDILWGAHSDDGRTDRLKVYLNNGSTWVLEPSIVLPVTFVNMQTTQYKSLSTGATLIDINADGIVDILTNTTTWIGTGSGWTNINFDPPNQFIWSATGADTGVRVEDIDADGLSDILVTYNDTQTSFLPKTNLSDGPFPNLLKSITLPTGGIVTLTYDSSAHLKDPSGNFLNSNLPLIKQVLTSIEVNDGRGLRATTNFSYKGGMYESSSREFRGFSEVTETLPNSTKTITAFFQDDQKKGMVDKTEIRDSFNRLLTLIDYDYDSDVDGQKPYFNPLLTQTTTAYSYSTAGTLTSQKTIRESRARTDYDLYGNLKRVVLEGDTSVSGDERTIFNEYFPNTTKWILRAPGRTGKIFPRIETNILATGFKAYNETIYKGNANANTPPQELRVAKSTQVGNDGNRSWIENTAFDSFGNVTATKDALGRTSQIYYDASNNHPAGFHPTRVVNPLNQTSQTFYDAQHRPYLSRDPNNIVTFTTFDEHHRPIRATTGPILSVVATTAYNYFGNPTSQHIRKEVKQDANRMIYSKEYFDGLGRTYKTISKGIDAAQDVLTIMQFNSMGQPYRSYLPVYCASDNCTSNRGYVQSTYDALGRVTRITNPDGSFATTEYDGWKTTVTNEKGVMKIFEKDAYGNVVKVTEHLDGAEHITRYQYNVLNQLIEVKDHLNNITTIVYNDLGRKTSMTDPDMGTWTYKYDDAGNLTEKVDANNCWMKMEYDSLNRLITKSDQLPGLPTGKTACDLVTYRRTYDTAANSPTNRGPSIGKLVTESGPDYLKEYFYDDPDGLGRLRKEVVTIKGKAINNLYTYNPDGTLSTATIEAGGPNETLLTYAYDNSGALYSLTRNRSGVTKDILKSIKRNENGQPTEKVLGNLVKTTMEYYNDSPDKDHRLKTLKTLDISNRAIQNFTYEYDVVGNLKKITDVKLDANYAPVTDIRNYAYDDLDRLIIAGSLSNKVTRTIGYKYNPIGNLIRQDFDTGGFTPFGRPPTDDPY